MIAWTVALVLRYSWMRWDTIDQIPMSDSECILLKLWNLGQSEMSVKTFRFDNGLLWDGRTSCMVGKPLIRPNIVLRWKSRFTYWITRLDPHPLRKMSYRVQQFSNKWPASTLYSVCFCIGIAFPTIQAGHLPSILQVGSKRNPPSTQHSLPGARIST
jgi:hypothetical protein